MEFSIGRKNTVHRLFLVKGTESRVLNHPNMLQHIVLNLCVGCPILKFGHIHIFQRELNPNLFQVDFSLGKLDNRIICEEIVNSGSISERLSCENDMVCHRFV